ncbi:MAG TPA: dTMP kinase, partial [Actinopolymorphaceae bacterium]|nr:dTMP kinase [Actinopolymorphaceae bacterium]
LYAADKAEHVDTVIRPALTRGSVVVTDRYVDTMLAYQGAGRDLSQQQVVRLTRWATNGLRPHLTVLLDVPPEVGLGRGTDAPDRLEREPLAFHQRAREQFLELAGLDPDRYLVLDASMPAEEIAAQIRARVEPLLLDLGVGEADRAAAAADDAERTSAGRTNEEPYDQEAEPESEGDGPGGELYTSPPGDNGHSTHVDAHREWSLRAKESGDSSATGEPGATGDSSATGGSGESGGSGGSGGSAETDGAGHLQPSAGRGRETTA